MVDARPQPSRLWRYSVYAFAAALSVMFAIICFAGSLEHLDYAHGWPWTFCVRDSRWPTNRFLPISDRMSLWSYQALAADLLSFAIGVSPIIALAFYMARRARLAWSLRTWMLLLTAMCVLTASLSSIYTHGFRFEEAVQQLRREHCYVGCTMRSPQWLDRLLGFPATQLKPLRRVFFRLEGRVSFWFEPRSRNTAQQPTTEVLRQLEDFPGARHVAFMGDISDQNLRRCLVNRSLRTAETLSIAHNHLNIDEALADLDKYPRLRKLRLSTVPVTNVGLAHLHDCEHLEELELIATEATNSGLESLAKLPALKTVLLKRQTHGPAVDWLRERGVKVTVSN